MSHSWTNWSGSITCQPQSWLTPQSEAEIQALIQQSATSGKRVRVVGTGHSFVPLCASDDILLSLNNLQGWVEVPNLAIEESSKREIATYWAGSKIQQMGDPLWDRGLAMANMGDIDRQALAGAISTGTHGTGYTLGNISSQVVGLRMVLASGEVIQCSESEETEIFKAAQVALGMLGIITQITLKCLPSYHLHERTWVATFEECVSDLESQIANNRHFEFFWSPHEDACAMKTLNPIELSAEEAGAVPLLPGGILGTKGEAQGRLARYIKEARIDRSYRIFPSERNLKFNEMEFAVPYASGVDCLCEIRQLMQTKHRQVLWPIEYRTLAADDIWLSPAYQRQSVTISIHQAAELDHREFFADAEAIFRNHKGRPHWGKLHSHQANDLRSLYPEWERFLAIRQTLDPTKRLMNDYLRSVFE